MQTGAVSFVLFSKPHSQSLLVVHFFAEEPNELTSLSPTIPNNPEKNQAPPTDVIIGGEVAIARNAKNYEYPEKSCSTSPAAFGTEEE